MNDIIEYFKNKAEKYDLVDQQIYWVLSDTLLWKTLNTSVLDSLREKPFYFLDAGGGTGRWTLKILEHFPQAKGVLFDLSEAMTMEAFKKAEKNNYLDRLTIVNGNLNDVNALLLENNCPVEYDLIFNFHNVLGFVDDPQVIIKNLAHLTKKEGFLVSFLPNKYHNIFFNLSTNAITEAEHVLEHKTGRFTNTMPYMHLFTPEFIKELYGEAQISIQLLTGFPNFIYPGFQETQLEGSTGSLENILQKNFDAIYNVEKSFIGVEEIASRANNLFVVGKREN